MKKLKIALSLLFAMAFSLFLVACGGKEDIVSVEIGEGTKKEFVEGEAFSTEGLTVIVKYRGSSEEVVLEEGQYDVDSSQYNADKAGTYTIVVTPKQDVEEGAEPVTQSYDVTVNHNWTASTEEVGTEVCDCGAKRTNLTGLNDKIVVGAWENPAAIEISENSPAEAPSNGESQVTYGVLVAGQSMTLTLQIDAADASSTWFTPLMGFRNGADGVLPREDLWIIVVTAGYTTPGMSAGAAPQGTATVDSPEWQVYYRGTSFGSEHMQPSGDKKATVVVQYDYSSDSIMTIRHTLTPADGSAAKELVYSVKVPNASYEICAYGEKCEYTVTAVETVMNTYMTDFVGTINENKVQPAGKMFDTSGVTTTATMSDGNEVKDLYSAYAMLDGAVVNLQTTPLQAGMTDFYVEFAGQKYYLTSDGTADGTDSVTVLPSQFTQVAASAVVKDAVFDATDVTFDYAVNAAEDAVEIVAVVTGTEEEPVYPKSTVLTAAQQTALGTTAKSFVSFRVYALAEGVTEVTVDNGGYAVLTDGVVEVVLPIVEGTNYTLTFKAGEETVQTAAVNLEDLVEPEVGVYISASDFTLDAGGSYTVVYTNVPADADDYQILTISDRATVAEIQDEINAEGEYTAVRNQIWISKVEWTAAGLEVTYRFAPASLANLTADNVTRLVSLRDAEGETQAEYYIYFNMKFSDEPTGEVAKVADGVYVYVNRDKMYVMKAFSAEEVNGKLEYGQLTFDVSLNIQNSVGESYALDASASASGVSLDAKNTLTNASTTLGKLVALGRVGDSSDYDYGALLMVEFSVTTLGLRAEDAEQVFYFTANEDTENGQDSYVVYTVGNEVEGKFEANVITSEEVTPTGERATLQEQSCMKNGYAAYTYGETGFKYGALVEYATGEHTFPAYDENNEAVCSSCGAVKTKYDLGNGTYTEIVLLSVGDADPIRNVEADGGWWVDFTEATILSDNFSVRYTWKSGETDSYVGNGAIVIRNANPAEGVTDGIYKRFLEGATTEGFGTLEGLDNTLIDATSEITYEILKNGEAATFADAEGADWTDAGFSVIVTRIGTTLTIEESATAANGDVWTSLTTITNFTTGDLATCLGGHIFMITNMTVTVGEATTIVNERIDEPVVFASWYEVPAALSQGRTLTVWGSQEGKAEQNYHSIVWEIRQGFTGRTDAYGWTFDPGNEYAATSQIGANYSVTSITYNGENYTLGAVDANLIALASACDYTITFNWATAKTVLVTVELDNGTNNFECTYSLPVTGENVNVLNIHLTNEAAMEYFTVDGFTLA